MLGAAKLRALAGADWQGRLPAATTATLRTWSALLPETAPAASRPPGIASSSAGAVAGPTASPAALSPRELEVLRHIAAGDSNKLIARAFDLSPHTVKRHVANILDKLVLQSRGQAAAWYRQHAARAAE
jgi:LuxR family maltose regulon positive regulatory protein